MHSIRLLHTCGHRQIDDILQGLIGVFEATFPERIRSYYLVGSYASGTAGSLSDIDLRVIFKDQFAAGEEEKMLDIRHYCRLISSVPLDCPPLSEHRLLHDENWLHEPLGIKAKGILLYGEDIRDQWLPPDFAAYVRNVTSVPVFRFGILRKRHSPLVFPLTYPDPTGEFYGYDQPDARGSERSLKPWVHAVGFGATCKIALKAGRIVASKEDWLPTYQQCINDTWTDWLTTVYKRCVHDWSYRIPTCPAQRTQLRGLCRQTLAFENHYLLLYLTYLLEELRAGEDTRRLFAIQRFRDIIYPVETVSLVLKERWPADGEWSATLATLQHNWRAIS